MKSMNRRNKIIFKFIVTVSIVISSAADAYVYAESVKDAKLKKT